MRCVLSSRTLFVGLILGFLLFISKTHAGPNSRVTQEEVAALKTGLQAALPRLETQVVTEVFNETYPLVGKNFGTAWSNNVTAFRYLTALHTAVSNALVNLPAQPDYAPSDVANAIVTRLTSAGFAAGTQVAVSTPNDGVALAFTTLDTINGANVRIAPDLALPNAQLDLLATANAQTSTTINFNFTVGVDGDGFFWNTGQTTFQFNTTTTATTLNVAVEFVGLPYVATDPTTDRLNVPLNFRIALRDPNNAGGLRLNEINEDFIDAFVTGNTKIALRLLSTLPTGTMVPKFGTDLKIRQIFSETPTNPNDDNRTFGGPSQVTLENNRVNLGDFFDNFATRAFREIDRYTGPLQPVIDALTAEIPVLSDLGSDGVTILHVLGVPPEVVAAIGGLARLDALAGLATSFSGNENTYADLGNYTLTGDLRTQPIQDLAGGVTRPPNINRDADLEAFMDDADFITGLTMPIVEDGDTVAKLLLGRPATLFTWNSGEIAFTEDFRQFFPVFGPVGVTLRGGVSLSTRFAFGYDTQGLIDYFEEGATDTSLFFNGFYALAADENNDPVTGITLEATIAAGIAANFGLASFGVEGDITATVGFYMDYLLADDDGRLRGDVLANTPLDDLFYAYGAFTAGLRAYVEVGFPPFSVSYDIESPRVTILDYDSRGEEVPVLAELVGDAIVLNVGERASRRIHGDTEDRAEEFKMTIDGAALIVTAFNEENIFTTGTSIIGQASLRGDILELDPAVNIPAAFTGGDSIDILIGGAANDTLEGNEGPDKLRGNGGHDILRGGIDNDELNGGEGNDTLNGGDGMDLATWMGALIPVQIDLRVPSFEGAAAGDTLISIERYAGTMHADTLDGSEGDDTLLRGLGGNDTIRGHGGIDVLEGGSGDDNIEGGAGQDLINGGVGADRLDGGDGEDTLSYLGAFEPVTISLLTGTGTRGDANGDVVSGFEILMGSGLPKDQATSPLLSGDTLEGSDNVDLVFGMEGADTIRGMGGNDVLHGNHPDAGPSLDPGFDDDTIRGGAGDDQIFGQEGDDDLDGEEGRDMLDGQIGDDHLKTFDLASIDILEGGIGYNRLSADYSDKQDALNFIVGEINTKEFPDGDKFSNIQTLGRLVATTGNDVVRLSRNAEPSLYPKNITGGIGDDLIIADWRGIYPVGQGSRSNDSLHGGDGNDTLSFEQSIGGVNVNLATLGTGNFASGITMSGFENVVGSNFGDVLTGDTNDNIFTPLLGGPESEGRVLDRVYGGDGNDTLRLDYSNDPAINAQGISMDPNATTGGEAIMIGPNWDTLGRYAILFYDRIERFEIIGGNARDRLYGEGVNFGGSNYDDRLIGMGGNDLLDSRFGNDFLDGGEGDDTLRPGSGNDTALGGPGNDNIHFEGRTYGDDFGDAGAGDDVVRASELLGGLQTYATASTRFRLDGGPGFDTLRVDIGHLTTPLILDTIRPIEIALPNDGYIRNFEYIASLITGSGNDRIVIRGRSDNAIGLLTGDDVINPGLGIDVLDGWTGDDLLILDYSDDDPTLTGVTRETSFGRHQRRSLADNALIDSVQASSFDRLHFTGSDKADTAQGFDGTDILYGRGGDDNLNGFNGNDFLYGGPGADLLNGSSGNDLIDGGDGGNDRLTGSSGADTFVLGTESQRYYGASRDADYAVVEDFSPTGGDRLRLNGNRADYLLGASPIEGVTGSAVYYDADRNGALDPAVDELIAVVRSTSTLTAANTINNANTVNSVEPAQIGLEAMEPIIVTENGAQYIALQFAINDPLPAGVTLEIQSSADIGRTIPWMTIATKTAAGSWSGSAAVTVGEPANGRVALTIRAPDPLTSAPHNFYRARITSP